MFTLPVPLRWPDADGGSGSAPTGGAEGAEAAASTGGGDGRQGGDSVAAGRAAPASTTDEVAQTDGQGDAEGEIPDGETPPGDSADPLPTDIERWHRAAILAGDDPAPAGEPEAAKAAKAPKAPEAAEPAVDDSALDAAVAEIPEIAPVVAKTRAYAKAIEAQKQEIAELRRIVAGIVGDSQSSRIAAVHAEFDRVAGEGNPKFGHSATAPLTPAQAAARQAVDKIAVKLHRQASLDGRKLTAQQAWKAAMTLFAPADAAKPGAGQPPVKPRNGQAAQAPSKKSTPEQEFERVARGFQQRVYSK